VLKLTKTLDIDFHNYYHWVLPATMVYFTTNNLIVGTIVGVCSAIITLKIADWTEKYVADWWELPGISIPHMSTVGWFPVAYLIDWVIDRIPGVNKIRIDSGNLQERLGVLGEPMLVGFILGLLMSIIAGLSFQDVLVTSMQLAASMILMPRMIGILMEGLVPIFQSARDWVVARFPDYDFRIGLDAAVLVGKAEVLTIGILMTPVMLLLAIILPGNRVLPFADLAIMTFFMIWSVGVNRGNLFRALIIGIVISSVILYGSAIMAPTLTQMGEAAGFEADTPGLYVSLEAGAIYGSQLIHALIVAILNLNAWVIAGITVVATAVLIPVFRWVTSLPRLAADLPEDERRHLIEMGYNIKA
jgi:PTS system galactitol-specific IIC component